MAKFTDFEETKRIAFVRDQFYTLIEGVLAKNDVMKTLETELKPEELKTAIDFAPSVRWTECKCDGGGCLDISKVDGKVPAELRPLIRVARKLCEAKTY